MPAKRNCVLVLVAILALNTDVFGQSIFQKRSDIDTRAIKFTTVFSSDTGFFVSGWRVPYIQIDTNTYQTGPYQILFSWYDWNGQLLKYKTFGAPQKEYNGSWFDALQLSDSNIFSFTTYIDTLNNSANTKDIIAIKFDLNGDTIWTKRYDSGKRDFGFSCIPDGEGGMIGVGNYISSNGQTYCTRAIRYNSQGDTLWNKTYNCASESFTKYIVKDTEGNYYISGYKRIGPSGGNAKNARISVLKIDSLGNVIWNIYLPAICDEYAGALAIAVDGNILVSNDRCYSQPTSQAVRSPLSFYKLNKNTGDTMWHTEFPTQYYKAGDYSNFIEVLNNGDILIGGSGIKLFIENGDTLFGKYAGVLIRTDSLGNMKWQRYYFYNEADAQNMVESYLTDGKETPDGGFILVGRTTHNTDFDDGWIIKTDANGCIDASCINGIEELEEDDYRLFIYPNPAQEYISIDLPITHNKATLQIINMQGQLVKTVDINSGGLQRIDTSDMANGIYQLLVIAKDKLIGKEKLVVGR